VPNQKKGDRYAQMSSALLDPQRSAAHHEDPQWTAWVSETSPLNLIPRVMRVAPACRQRVDDEASASQPVEPINQRIRSRTCAAARLDVDSEDTPTVQVTAQSRACRASPGP